jgi:hypothetical protein
MAVGGEYPRVTGRILPARYRVGLTRFQLASCWRTGRPRCCDQFRRLPGRPARPAYGSRPADADTCNHRDWYPRRRTGEQGHRPFALGEHRRRPAGALAPGARAAAIPLAFVALGCLRRQRAGRVHSSMSFTRPQRTPLQSPQSMTIVAQPISRRREHRRVGCPAVAAMAPAQASWAHARQPGHQPVRQDEAQREDPYNGESDLEAAELGELRYAIQVAAVQRLDVPGRSKDIGSAARGSRSTIVM